MFFKYFRSSNCYLFNLRF